MHGLPDGAAFGVDGGDGLEDLRRAGFPGLRDVEGLLFSPHGPAQVVRVDDQAGKPEIRDGILFVVRIHMDEGQVGEAGFIALVDGPFLSYVLAEMGDLAADDPGDYIRHAIMLWVDHLRTLSASAFESVRNMPPLEPVMILLPLKEIHE